MSSWGRLTNVPGRPGNIPGCARKFLELTQEFLVGVTECLQKGGPVNVLRERLGDDRLGDVPGDRRKCPQEGRLGNFFSEHGEYLRADQEMSQGRPGNVPEHTRECLTVKTTHKSLHSDVITLGGYKTAVHKGHILVSSIFLFFILIF